jgi:hypothetical protein
MLIIIIVILIFYISTNYQLNRNRYFNKLPKIYPHNFKTGDVIILCSDGLYDSYNIISYGLMEMLQYYIMKNFTTHAGIIITYNGKPYVYHMTAYPVFDDYKNIHVVNGPVYQDANKYIESYPGHVLLYRAPFGIDVSCMHNMARDNKYKYSINPLNWLIDLNFKTNYFTKNNELYCYELVAYILGISKYRNISSKELLTEIRNRGYTGPILLNNLYQKYRFEF